MSRFLFVAALLLTLSLMAFALHPRAASEAEIYAKLTTLVQTNMSQNKLPGAAVAVVRGNKITFAQGFGLRDVAKNLPVTTDTLFHIGSTHKSMTAMMIGTLVDEGKVTWDTKAVTIYPQFKLSNDQSTQTVTMRQLLNMTSGIPSAAEDNFDVGSSAEELFTYMQTAALNGQPGQRYDYSNMSYSLAGYLGVLAHDSTQFGQLYEGYANLFKAKILTPIGMTHSVVRYSEAQANPNYGKSYVIQNGQAVEAAVEDGDSDPLAPSGALKANVTDMARYISTQLNNGVTPDGQRVISEASLAEIRKPYLNNYGLGWDVLTTNGMTHYTHDGVYDNYVSTIGFVPGLNMGYVVLANSEAAGDSLVGAVPEFLLREFAALPNATATPGATGGVKIYLPVIIKGK